MLSQKFFYELKSLLSRYPKVPPHILNSENCDYGDNIYYSKNLSFCFDDANCTDGVFVYDSYMTPNCIDCDYCVESELCYECVDCFKCFNSNFLENCGSTRDSWYSHNCINCHDVFGCVDLQNKSFCIFNRQLLEADYRQQIQKYKSWSAEKVLQELENLKKHYPLTQTNEAHNENSPYGDYVYFDKNCYMCFDAAHNENSSYLYDSFYNKNCYDMTYASQNNQVSYEVVDSGNLFNCSYAVFCQNSHDSMYIFNCQNVKDCIGCVSLTNKQYCILNRQLSKEEYEKYKKSFLQELQNQSIGWNNLIFSS